MLKGLNKLSKQIHKNNCEKGFYDEKREIGTLLMLCVSELSEALEADRKDKHCNLDANLIDYLNDKDGTSQSRFPNIFQSFVKDTFEDEIADAFIRLFDLAGHLGINIEWHIEQKVRYNMGRKKKHGKSY